MPMIITIPRLPDNPVVFANESFVRLTGYQRDGIVGRNCRCLQGPDTDPATRQALHDAVKNVVPIETDITRARTGAGAEGLGFRNMEFRTRHHNSGLRHKGNRPDSIPIRPTVFVRVIPDQRSRPTLRDE